MIQCGYWGSLHNYLSMQELLLLIICPSHSIHQWEIVCTVKQILEADMYEIVDLKVKIITKI